MQSTLLTRDQFREAVFKRDGYKCVICERSADSFQLDAHHIIERRLFDDGGYYIDNGVTVCSEHHKLAESTELSCEDLRSKAGILRVVLPTSWYPDATYDKWGNQYLPNGQRLQGPLFNDPSVQKVIRGEFTHYVKYPRTLHVSWSPGGTDDDRYLSAETIHSWIGTEVVITEKLDGENTTFYSDYIHARSLDYAPHPSRDRIKALHASIAHDIPDGFRICGENLYAKHSIHYTDLESFFLVFSVWNKDYCLPWTEVVEWCGLLGLKTVPLLWRGEVESVGQLKRLTLQMQKDSREGVVIRPAGGFVLREFSSAVGKWVRPGHVTSSSHWKFEQVIPNKLRET